MSSPFTIDMSSPFPDPTSFTQGHGGPNSGGHKGPHWYIQFGMDLGANGGTEVRATFDAHITRFTPHVPSKDTDRIYGAQLFMRSTNDMMGGFYTHITEVPAEIKVGSQITRGDLLGKVIDRFPPHLHLALVEIIGGAPGGQYKGVDLYSTFLDMVQSGTVKTITFNQDGSPPTVN
jgi:murein DD-endopeptidase MepM/ murein hydrolase activator NlpD